jgi:RHS repeat-associated protein
VYGTADSGNRYPTVGGTSYTYDANSNLTSDGVWSFTYDSENRLVNASKTGTTVAYLYDSSNRQVQKTVNGVKTRYLYDGISMIASYDTSGNLQNRFVFTDNPDEVVAMVSNSGVVTYFNQDGNRSILAATDSSGAILQKFTYSPYGESSSASGWMFGYTGQRYDSETGLYYFKNRYYSPKLGRFLQPDPLGIKAGLNLLTYAGCDPLNKRDPLGLFDVYDDGWLFTVSIHPVPPNSPLPDWGWHASIIATHYVTHSWSYQVNGRNFAKGVGEITTYDFSAGPSDYNMGGNIMEYAGFDDQKADWRRQTQSGEGIVIKTSIQTGQAGQATFDALLHAAQAFAPVDPQYLLLGASIDAHGSNSNNYIAYLLEATNLGRADTKGPWAPGLDQPTPVAPGSRPSIGRDLGDYQVSKQIINSYGPIGPYKAAG